jgi:hypothetical protein
MRNIDNGIYIDIKLINRCRDFEIGRVTKQFQTLVCILLLYLYYRLWYLPIYYLYIKIFKLLK